MILSLTFGALIGEIIDIDGLFERFGEWLKHRTGSDGDNQFTNGFVAASLRSALVLWRSSDPFRMASMEIIPH